MEPERTARFDVGGMVTFPLAIGSVLAQRYRAIFDPREMLATFDPRPGEDARQRQDPGRQAEAPQ